MKSTERDKQNLKQKKIGNNKAARERGMVCLAPRTPPALVNQQTDWFMLVAYREPGITRITFSSSAVASNPS